MIPSIGRFYLQIAESMTTVLPVEWSSAEFHALFYANTSTYEAEYVRPDGFAIGFQPASDGSRAIRELRRLFKEAGQPVWGQVLFSLRDDGSFNARWGYDGCDANGDLPFDADAEVRRHDERRTRLIAGRPREV
jgi:hypothetical protein